MAFFRKEEKKQIKALLWQLVIIFTELVVYLRGPLVSEQQSVTRRMFSPSVRREGLGGAVK